MTRITTSHARLLTRTLAATLSAALLLSACSDDAATADKMLGAQRDAAGPDSVLVQQAGTADLSLDVPAATSAQLTTAGVDGTSGTLDVYVSCAEAADTTLTLDGADIGSVTCTPGGSGDWTSVSTDPVDLSAEHSVQLTWSSGGEVAVTVSLPSA